jgi:hypothetical protein
MMKELVQFGGAMLRQEEQSSVRFKKIPPFTAPRQNMAF